MLRISGLLLTVAIAIAALALPASGAQTGGKLDDCIRDLIGNAGKRTELAHNALKFGFPDAAACIADHIYHFIIHKTRGVS